MSQVKSPQQILARLIKEKYGNSVKIISIMPCFDKKL
jgi:iron only hydrogenase large subunit-like protein